MIVVDVNVVAYLYLPSDESDSSEELLLQDEDWAVPRLWRSEFSNILTTYVRRKLLSLDEAVEIHRRAQALLSANEFDVPPTAVLRLASDSGCTAYDCEYVALAEHLNVKLVSADRKLCKAFPSRAVPLSEA